MKRRAAVAGFVLFLIFLEAARRVFFAADCYVHLRYSDLRVGEPKAESRQECVDRHLWFPLRF